MLLTIMHTMLMRYHNKVADELSEINRHWDDETVYQESRNIIVSIMQHMSYKELLPVILGPTMMDKYGLKLTSNVCIFLFCLFMFMFYSSNEANG